MNWLWDRCELGEPRKLNRTVDLMKTEKALVTLNEDALAIPVKINGQQRGYVFHGTGKFAIDSIVETSDGAFGKALQQELNGPFLAVMSTALEEYLTSASEHYLKTLNYENQNAFRARAESLCCRFFGATKNHFSCPESANLLFAFTRQDGARPDLLIVHDNKLVYKSPKLIFVTGGHSTLLKSPEGVLIDNGADSFMLKKNGHMKSLLLGT